MTRTEGNFHLEDVEFCDLAGMTVEQGLEYCIGQSQEAYTVWFEKKVLAHWGISSSSFLFGCQVWMLTTVEIDSHPIFAARFAKEMLSQLLFHYHSVTALVDPSRTKAVRWLEFLGFRRSGFREHLVEMKISKGGIT